MYYYYYYILYFTIIFLSIVTCGDSQAEVKIYRYPPSSENDLTTDITFTCSGMYLSSDMNLCFYSIDSQYKTSYKKCSVFVDGKVFNHTVYYRPTEHDNIFYCVAARNGKVVLSSEEIKLHINNTHTSTTMPSTATRSAFDKNTVESENSLPEVKIFRSPPSAKDDHYTNITFTCSGINLPPRSSLCLKYNRSSIDSYRLCSGLFSEQVYNYTQYFTPTERDNNFYCVARQERSEDPNLKSERIALQIKNANPSKITSPSTDKKKGHYILKYPKNDTYKTILPTASTDIDALDNPGDSNVTWIVLGILSVGLVVAFGAGYYYYRRCKKLQEDIYTYATQPVTYAELDLDETILYAKPQVNQTLYTKIIGVFKPKQ